MTPRIQQILDERRAQTDAFIEESAQLLRTMKTELLACFVARTRADIEESRRKAERRARKEYLAARRRAFRPMRDLLFNHLLRVRGARCAMCGATDRLSIDHVIPVCEDGPDELWNLQVLCVPCNSSKGGKCPDVAIDLSEAGAWE